MSSGCFPIPLQRGSIMKLKVTNWRVSWSSRSTVQGLSSEAEGIPRRQFPDNFPESPSVGQRSHRGPGHHTESRRSHQIHLSRHPVFLWGFRRERFYEGKPHGINQSHGTNIVMGMKYRHRYSLLASRKGERVTGRSGNHKPCLNTWWALGTGTAN